MKLEHMASSDEMPGSQTGINDIVQDAGGDVRYYDIMGREVVNPVRGQFLITSDHRKIIY